MSLAAPLLAGDLHSVSGLAMLLIDADCRSHTAVISQATAADYTLLNAGRTPS